MTKPPSKLKSVSYIYNNDSKTELVQLFSDDAYQEWLARRIFFTTDTRFLNLGSSKFDASPPFFHLIIRLPEGFETLLADTIDSLIQQIYENWRLDIISPLVSPEVLEEIPQIGWHTLDSDEAYKDTIETITKASPCNWIIELPPGAKLDILYLWRLATEILSTPEKYTFFVDDDCIDESGDRHSPRFKPGTNPGHLQATDLAGPICVHKDIWITSGGSSRENLSPWYDQLLRITDKFGWNMVRHIPDVLITYSDKFPSDPASCQASLGHSLLNKQIEGEIKNITEQSWDVRYALKTSPTVTIAILSIGQLEFISRCLDSIITKTRYPDFEILIVTNEITDDPEIDQWLKKAVTQSDTPAIRFIYAKTDANHASRCNIAVASSENDLIVLVREETVFVQDKWLEELVRVCQQQEIGAASPLIHQAGDAKILASGNTLGLLSDLASPYSGKAQLGEAGYLDCLQVTRDVTALHSSCIIARKNSYLEAGGMDEVELGDHYAEVDLCLKMRKQGKRLVVHPRASVVYGGDTVEYDQKRYIEESIKKIAATRFFRQRWGKDAAVDPFWNPNLSLANVIPQPETQFRAQWQYLPCNKPRILAHPIGNGQGDFRVVNPLTAARKAGLTTECVSRQTVVGAPRFFTAAEIARLEPTSLIVQNYIHDISLAALDEWRASSCRPFVVYALDDLINDLDKTNPYRKHIPPNARSRLKYALARCDRLVVSTDFLAETYRHFIGDIQVVPNRLEKNIWCPLSSLKNTGKKPRIGWAGGSTHQGDLLLLKEIIEQTRYEADWIFFGMCPDEIRPLLAEYHDLVTFNEYPAHLASLNLDIAVAPLTITPFNQGKSNLRLLEYGALGIPVVCTDIDPYRNSPACRVENSAKNWIAALRERIYDADAREREGVMMREWVHQHYLLEDHLEEWLYAHLPSPNNKKLD
jgi:GT2 family glycosyltransferase/glycosyltransferase involved in cell wall biosynthesis